MVPDDKVGEVPDVMDGDILAQVTGDNQAVADAGGHPQFMVLQHDPLQAADPHQPGELAVLDEFRGEGVGHQDLVPVLAPIGVLDQRLDFVRAEPPPVSGRPGVLLVTQIVFCGVWGQVGCRNELAAEFLQGQNLDITHRDQLAHWLNKRNF